MSAVSSIRRNGSPEDYLAFEDKSLDKHEFFDGEIFAMAGASRQHNDLNKNLGGEIFPQLKGSTCNTYSSDMRVKVPRTGFYTYPDYVIVCGVPEFETILGLDTLLNPVVVFEILSRTTEAFDRDLKFQHYKTIPSFREYVLIGQDRVQVLQFVRQQDETWEQTILIRPAEELVLSSVPVRLTLADLYRDVDLANSGR